MLKLIYFLFKYHKKELLFTILILVIIILMGIFTNYNNKLYILTGSLRGSFNLATLAILIIVFIVFTIRGIKK